MAANQQVPLSPVPDNLSAWNGITFAARKLDVTAVVAIKFTTRIRVASAQPRRKTFNDRH